MKDPSKVHLGCLIIASYAIYVGGSICAGQGFVDGLAFSGIVGALLLLGGKKLSKPLS